MLQAVFVVTVNLQGLFIFCFHCVRNTTVRSEWKQAFSWIPTVMTSSTNVTDGQTYNTLTHLRSWAPTGMGKRGHLSGTTKPVFS